MTHDEIRKQIEYATKVVETWPAWKQNILAHSSSPAISQPREPVDNHAVPTAKAPPPLDGKNA
ncbi:hypothetical protein [Lignipirellula cremea]|uniref:Uncharacterized protein n=1 Tax=Lignipirellula cremea TaxID=2528010 RepID=A0A518E314_9BACT|nr:hypothetical protein [Lignipirellula cremea]QDU98477.1 hypothetical protein Pla8534_63460 [Lignipirellula cremea]